MHLTPEQLEIVRDVLRRYVPAYDVRAFGSRVSGKNLKPASDLDLVIMTQTELSGAVLMQVRDAFSLALLPFRVDVLDWAALSASFRDIINAEFIVVQSRPAMWDQAFASLEVLPSREVYPGFRARFVHSANHTLAFWVIDKGASFPEHNHVYEQTSIVTRGEFELEVEGKTEVLTPGKIAVIAPHKKHSGIALTDCEITDIFYPVRHDYLEDVTLHAR